MTHIEQMIQDMCPHGVEFKTLGEVCTCTKGQQLNKSGLLEEGYPVINGGINPSGYWNEYNYPANTITISQGGASAGYVNYMKTPFWAGAHCYVLIDAIPEVNYKFLYYLVKQSESTLMQCQYGAGIPALGAKTVNAIPIPLPPVEIQERIIAILDRFSALAAELQAELQMRRKQYEYYRTQLLTPHSDCNSATKPDDAQWEWKTLGEICEIRNGKDYKHLNDGKYPVYGSGGIMTYKDQYVYNKPSVLLPRKGSINKIHYVEEPFWNVDTAFYTIINESVVLPKYLFYYLSTIDLAAYNTGTGAIPSLTQTVLKALSIPLPSLAEQARIVSILDKFEALTTSLSDGIPAEQAAQQKRYEYYRDKLLTFEKRP